MLHLPGHTPEHIGLLVTDRTRGSEPWLVLTGHTLMVGDMGRTELASSAEDGARGVVSQRAAVEGAARTTSDSPRRVRWVGVRTRVKCDPYIDNRIRAALQQDVRDR